MAIDTTKFTFSFRLQTGGQILEYPLTEINQEAAYNIFRLFSLHREVVMPRALKQIRAEQAEIKKNKPKRTKKVIVIT